MASGQVFEDSIGGRTRFDREHAVLFPSMSVGSLNQFPRGGRTQ